ncbi:hypothetical protein M1M94_01210 [Thermodesulfovibrionales bacterium]|nr:hypothetical protein [Thermodesulfovibrionales bacterium]
MTIIKSLSSHLLKNRSKIKKNYFRRDRDGKEAIRGYRHQQGGASSLPYESY